MNFLRFGFGLSEQYLVELLERGRSAGEIAFKVFAVRDRRTPVDYGLLLCSDMTGSHELLTEGEHKFRLELQRVIRIGVVGVHIHCVDMRLGIRRNADDLAAERAYEMPVLALGVHDDNVGKPHEYEPDDLLFCKEGFARAGSAEVISVAIQKLLAVHKYQIAADGVLTAVEAVLVTDLLRGEGHEHGGALGRERPKRVYPAKSIREYGDKSLQLLIGQLGLV